MKVNDKGCSLLDDNLCRIQLEKGYDLKPTMCKLFPFSFMVKWNGDLLLIIKHFCKGIKKGHCEDNTIKHVIECCEELYLDSLEEILLMGMEQSSKTKLNKTEEISWEEREELGRYIFKSENLDELSEKCKEILNYDISERIESIKNNLNRLKLNDNKYKENEKEIIRFLGELNRREHFRKLDLKKEVDKLIGIGEEISKYRDVLKGEGVVDLKLLNQINI
ncbi:MAG: uncharacterized protein PWP15_360 [Methanothermococcus sp.]|nr:uncharacterized protein [Methanothermococcus sp.]MDK2987981.1 uncharacterized protein [Methanothermococcus sp.]